MSLPIAFVANLVVARSLGSVQFGYLATLMTAYTVAVSIANAGVSDAVIQWGSAAFARGDTEESVDLVRRCAGYHLLVETPAIVIVTVVLLRSSSWPIVVAACAAAGLTTAIGTASVAQTFLSRTATLARVVLASNVALQVAVVTTALSSHASGPTWAARVVASSVVPLVLWRLLPRPLGRAVVRPLLPTRWPPGFAAYATKAAVGGLVSAIVFSRTELFVLQADRQHVAAGVYALGFGLAAQLTAPIDAVLGPMVPAAASLAATEPGRVGAALLRGLRFTATSAGALAALTVAPLAALIPVVYGAEFHQVAALILPLALISCVQSLSHPVTAFAYGTRRVGTMLIINATAALLDIAIAIGVVGSLHAWGAVLANGVAQVTALAAATAVLRRGLGIPMLELLASLRAFFEGGIAAVCGWAVATTTLIGFSSVPRAVVGAAVSIGAFSALQRIGRPALNEADVKVLAAALRVDVRSRAIRILRVVGVA
jgi:O-antigen/teichoic acid export membrane protein